MQNGVGFDVLFIARQVVNKFISKTNRNREQSPCSNSIK